MSPTVSVLMATYNMAKYLPVAIQSVLDQEFEDFELLIGDNVSTDETSVIARRFSSLDSRVKYHRNEEHLTAAENFNACLERSDSRSKYWIMLASDDWWKPEMLRTLVDIAEVDPTLTFVHCDATIVDPDGQPIGVKYSELWPQIQTPQHGRHQAAEALFHGCYVMALATLVNRNMKDAIYPVSPLMDPSLVLAPDHNLWLQLMIRGAKAFFIDEPLAYYRKHQTAMTMPWNDVARLHEEVMIFGEKLNSGCPSRLEPIRLEALRNRYAQLGFGSLATKDCAEAQHYLEQAIAIPGRRRLDIFCARWISALPLPSSFLAGVWKSALNFNELVGKTR
jgi:glycosyltransferase involved in cell wall biosynthesis